MPSNITVRVHVKPYLKKYLIHISTNKAGPVIFPKRHHFTAILLPLLIPKSRYILLKGIESDENRPLNFVNIMLPWQETWAGRPGIKYTHYLSPNAERVFRLSVARYYRMKLNEFVTKRIFEGYSRVDAVNMFMADMTISEDDINSESIYRSYSRLKAVLC